MPRIRGRARRGSAVIAAMAFIGFTPVAAADSEASAGFVARASAAGARLTYGIPGFLVVSDFVDGGGPYSDALVDVSGGNAFASVPYPGQLVIAAPGLLAGFGGPSLPYGYPFYAAASHPSVPEAGSADPTGSYDVTANAGPATAVGVARLSAGKPEVAPTQLSTRSSVEQREDGTVVATAESVIQGLSLGDGALTIAKLVSRSVTTSTAQADPKTEDTLVIEGASVGGTPVTIGRDGVKLLGAEIPAGPSSAEGLNEALAEAGLAVRVVDGLDIDGGRRGALLEVRSLHALPGGATGDLALQLGAVSSSVLLGGAAGEPPAFEDVPPASAEQASPPPAETVELSPEAPADPTMTASVATFAGAQPVPKRLNSARTEGFPAAPYFAAGETATASPAEPEISAPVSERPSVPPTGGQLEAMPASNALAVDVDNELKAVSAAIGLTALVLGLAGAWRRKKGGVTA